MLQNLRDKAQGWMAWIIIGLISTTFVLFGTSSLFTPSKDSVIAKVNGTKITASQLDTLYQRLVQQAGDAYVEPNFAKKELLQSLIEQTILLKAAQHLGMKLSAERISSFLHAIPFLSVDGQFSKEAYRRFLSSTNHSDHSFRQLITESLLKEQLQQGIIASAFVLENDIDELTRLLLQQRDFRYFIIKQTQDNVSVTAQEVEAYYQAHSADFLTPEKVSLEYLPLSLAQIMAEQQVSSQELETFYQENTALFTVPERLELAHILITSNTQQARQQIEQLHKKIVAGESFAALAKQHSKDPASAKEGGYLGWFSVEQMIPEFEKAALALQKDQVSEPIQSAFGFHLIKLLDSKKAQTPPFLQIQSQVAEKFKEQLAREKLALFIEQLSNEAYDHPDSLEPAAEKLGIKVKKTPLFDVANGPQEALLQNASVISAMLSPSVKQEKNNSELIKIDDQNYLVLRIAEEETPVQKSLDEVKLPIQALLVQQKKEEVLQKHAQTIYQQVTLNPSLKKYSWQEYQATRTDKQIDPDLVQAVFSLPKPSVKALFKLVRLSNGDYAVIWLHNVKDGDPSKLTHQEKQDYQLALAKHYGELEYALYTAHLLKHANVKSIAQF